MFRAYAQISPTETQFIDESDDFGSLIDTIIAQFHKLVRHDQPILFWHDVDGYCGCLNRDNNMAYLSWPHGQVRAYELQNGKFERVRF